MAADKASDHVYESFVYVFDRRKDCSSEIKINLGGLINLELFLSSIRKQLHINADEKFVVVTTERKELNNDEIYEQYLEPGDTLYILQSVDEELAVPVCERVQFLPHFDTLTKSGMYEYYASEGQDPLPFAFAELIDNALYATANSLSRKIEIRLMFDDTTNRNSVCVLDNGCGMTSKDLNEWAIYRLSKFNRRWRNKQFVEKTLKKSTETVSRSLNSDISYFGVGGKQAIFFIGNATRMISKCKGSSDVHEMMLSKDEFETKEQNKESIYSGVIYNRQAGDTSHVPSDDESLRKLISEEVDYPSFTNVFITGVKAAHVTYMKSHFDQWCRQLTHIYHYYLHGPLGNVTKEQRINEHDYKNIDIQISLFERGKAPRVVSLKDIEDDMQTLYIRTAASTFDFKAHINGAQVEGQLRYHPFLYDKETYPLPGDDLLGSTDGEEEELLQDNHAPRGNRPIFECFWNGRLIPYTHIKCLEWCDRPRKRTLVPMECYNRFSGALWTNDSFQVSTNKLTFIDLETKLLERNTLYNRVITGQEQRLQISKAFHDWIQNCHEMLDKQIRFFGLKGQVKRSDSSGKKKHDLWSMFSGIDWHGKRFQEGDIVRTCRTNPVIVGTIRQFFLHGEYDTKEVYATGGEVELVQEPVSLFGEKKVYPLVKLDLLFDKKEAKTFIANEELKLPAKLVIEWPEGNELKENSDLPAGSTIGAMKVDIRNGKGDSIHHIPGDRGKRLLVELKVIWHSEKNGNKVIIQHTCQHGGKSWPYWFRKMENTVNLGKHSLFLKVVFADPTAYSSGKARRPTEVIKFNVIEGAPFKFIISHIESPLKIGVPFQISLKLVDYYGNSTKPDKENMELTITGSGGLALSHGGTAVRGMLMFVRDVVALGSLSYNNGKDFNIKLVLTGLDDNTQVTKLRFLPGLPSMLEVKPLGNEIRIGNGENLKMEVVVKDKVGNITPQPELNVVCKLSGRPGLPSFSVDCSSTGKGILTSPDIDVADIRDGAVLQAKINLLHFKSVETVKKSIYVSPSIRPAQFQLFYVPPDSEIPVRIHNDDELLCKAGDFIQGITYRILDEGKRLLNIDSNMTYKVKVNWVSKLSKDQLKLGNLPDIRTPTIANETKFCQICYNGITNVHFTFTIRAISNKIDVLSSLCSSNKIIPGEKFSKIISVSLTDKYGNKINPDAFDVKDLQIYGGGIITEKADVEMNKSGEILISNLDFCDNIPGVRELHLQYKGLQAYQRLEMLPGPVAELVIVDHENLEEPVSIYNGHPWKEPLRVQMVDAAGYSCREVNKKISLVKEGDLKISPSNSLTQRTDANGVAVFKDFCLTSPTCSGTYGISPKLHLDQHTVITGPSLTVHVLPDPNKSTSILVESFPASVKAGQPMEVTKGCVLAEDRNPLTKLSHKDVTLCIQLAAAPQKKGKIYYASQRELNDKMNFFYFRDITAPEKAGLHSMFINYNAGSCKNLHSEKMMLIVTPDEPAYLSPLVELPTPTVSNTNNVSSRTLVKNFKLNIMDEWRNRTGEKLTGRVIVSVNNNLNETPLLNNNQTSVCYPLIEGAIDIDRLTVAVGTSGLDCQEYQLEFKLILVGQMKHNVKPYVLPFLFYNDAKKQQQMSQLVKDRDALVQSINTYRTYFKTTQQLINEMKVVIEEELWLNKLKVLCKT